MRIDRARLKAWTLLTWSVISFWLSRLNPFRARRGLQEFLAQYAGDGARAVDAREREHAPERGLCVLCGLCDAIAAEHGAQESPLDFAVALSRPTAGVPDRGAQSLGDTEIARAIAARCPMGVRL